MILFRGHARRLDALEEATDRQRARVAAAAVKARASLSPEAVMAEAGARLGGPGALAKSVRAAPGPSLLAGFGFGWLVGARIGRGRSAPGVTDALPECGEASSALGACAFIAGAMAAGASTFSPRGERCAVEAADRAREGWDYGVRARGGGARRA